MYAYYRQSNFANFGIKGSSGKYTFTSFVTNTIIDNIILIFVF